MCYLGSFQLRSWQHLWHHLSPNESLFYTRSKNSMRVAINWKKAEDQFYTQKQHYYFLDILVFSILCLIAASKAILLLCHCVYVLYGRRPLCEKISKYVSICGRTSDKDKQVFHVRASIISNFNGNYLKETWIHFWCLSKFDYFGALIVYVRK